jgi:nucleolin
VKDQAEMMGRWLNVSLSTSGGRPSTAPRSQELSERPAGCKTVFVGNMSWQATEEDLRAAFADCGEINNVRIAWDQENDRSKGFAHVEFERSVTHARMSSCGALVIVCFAGSNLI